MRKTMRVFSLLSYLVLKFLKKNFFKKKLKNALIEKYDVIFITQTNLNL